MDTKRRVVITGLGVISSIGIGKTSFWDSILQGRSGIGPVTAFDTSNQFTHNGGEVNRFDPAQYLPEAKVNIYGRASQMAFASAKLSLDDSRLSAADCDRKKVGVCIGITSGPVQGIEDINDALLKNNTVSNVMLSRLPVHSASAIISRELGFDGPNFLFSTACAAGNYALGYGFDLIRLNRADIMLCGGSDSFSRISFTGFNQFSAVAAHKCQPFDKNRKGMMVAEGAGTLVLESLESAIKRNALIYAEILGYGLSCDAFHMTTSSIEGIAACMKSAIRSAGIETDDVNYISAHGTGTIANDKNECAAIKNIFGSSYKGVPVSSIKSMLGHTMGAASAIEAIACSLSVKNDIVPPTINYETPDPECDIDCVPNHARKHTVNIALNNSYAFGGNNACLVLSKFS